MLFRHIFPHVKKIGVLYSREYNSQWFQGMFGLPTGVMSVSKDMNELWQFYMQEWQQLTQPWLHSWLQSPGNLGGK